MNRKGFINIAIIIGILILVGVTGYFAMNRQTSSPKLPILPMPTSLIPSTQNPSLNNDCQELVSQSVKAYQDGWEKTFKKENNLSDSEFNTYITVADVSLRSIGNTCKLTVSYTVKKDWLLINRVDGMTLGVPPTISPDNLPLESDPTKPGRIGVSAINLHNTLPFNSETEALNYFVNIYNLKGSDAKVQDQGFQYFWNKESAEESGYSFAGEGGEAFISIFGIINSDQNKCYRGELALVSKETIYSQTPCRID